MILKKEIIQRNKFDCEVQRKGKRKTASLQVSPSNAVSIIVPDDLSMEKISDIIRKKTPWILSKIKFNLELKYPHKPKEFVSGETITYLGRNYRLKIKQGQNQNLQFKNGRFIITVREGTNNTERLIRHILTDWLIKHAEIKLKERVRRFEKHIGASYTAIRIKTLKQRWGSCTKDGAINLNWRIIIAPVSIVDYVVAHELCHRIYHDHSKAFWKLLERVMPDYRTRKEWLRVNGALLDI